MYFNVDLEVTIISNVCWIPDLFPMKRVNDHFPASTDDIWKMLNATLQHPRPFYLNVLVLRLTDNCTSFSGFATMLLDVPLEL